MLYSKNGSIPKPETDGTEGWVQVPDAPTDVPADHEVYWDGFEWLLIPPKPASRPGYEWAFYKNQGWLESVLPTTESITIEYADSITADSVGADSV
jgi:hypothetical protein